VTEISVPSPRQAPSAADVVRVLQAAYPNAWEKHLRNLGVTAPTDLPPAELTQFTNRVFWLVRQSGIKDPAAWVAANPAPVEATVAAATAPNRKPYGADLSMPHLGDDRVAPPRPQQRPHRRSLRSPELQRRPEPEYHENGQQPLHHPGGPRRSSCAAPESSATTRPSSIVPPNLRTTIPLNRNGDVDQQPYSRLEPPGRRSEVRGHRQQIGKSAALTVGALALARAALRRPRH
jgi:hypothetical protein